MKNKIKKIGALMCVLVFAFGFCTTYSASEDKTFEYLYNLCAVENDLQYKDGIGEITYPSYLGTEYSEYALIKAKNGDLYMVLSNSDTFKIKCDETTINKVVHYRYWLVADSGYCRSTDDGKTWTSLFKPSSTFNADIQLGLVDSSSHSLYDEPRRIVESSVPIMYGDYELFAKTAESYNPEIGYLQNVNIRTAFLTDKDGNVDYNSFRRKVNYDMLTTSGIDLSQGDYCVRVYGQMAYYKTLDDVVYDDEFPLVYFGSYDVGDGSFSYMSQELYDLVTISSSDPYTAWDIFSKKIVRSDYTYLQIYNKSTGECGGYLKIALLPSSGTKQTTLDYDFNVDNGGFIDKDVVVSAGSGTNYDDAEMNANKNYDNVINGNYDGFESAINSFTSTLGVVPIAIGSVFSFLPAWCHDYIGLCFALLVALVVWKLLRG